MEQTPKQLALQLGALISLYLSLSFLATLIFSIINLAFPDAQNSVWQISSYSSSARWGIAMVVVFFPTYLILTRLINNFRRKNATNHYLSITKWLIYLSLLVAGLVILGDLVAVIMAFLNGELTIKFFLKALTLFALMGAAFTYYTLDARDFWLTREKLSLTAGVVTGVVALIFIIIGFVMIDNPKEVRERNIDNRQLSDLQSMQGRVAEFIYEEGRVPETLDEAYGTYGRTPEAPEGRRAYIYESGENIFKLCANFTYDRDGNYNDYYSGSSYYGERFQIVGSDNWNYQAGEFCFERTVIERPQNGVEMIVR